MQMSEFACMLIRVQLYSPLNSLSMELSRQEYSSGLPFLSSGYLPDSGIEPVSLAFPTLAGRFFTSGATKETRGPGTLNQNVKLKFR